MAFQIENGVLKEYKEVRGVTDVVIPDGVTDIDSGAFSYCEHIKSVIIPQGVTCIGDSAFYGCCRLTEVVIPQGVVSIGNEAFGGCESLTGITIPDGVTSIGNSAFSGCESLTSMTIPDSVISIGDYAFIGCKNLSSITIPKNIASVGHSVFNDCDGLLDSSGLIVICGILYWCRDNVTSVTIHDGVTSIGKSAFCRCESLTSVTIPASVTSIGEKAFFNCESLVSAPIPSSVTYIGNQAFGRCTKLTEVIIPESVTYIGDGTFYGCENLTRVVIPTSVISIGEMAFFNCESLISAPIPDSVIHIGNQAFGKCTKLTEVTIPESVTHIGEWAFYGCENLTKVNISPGVASIGNQAFEGCKNLTSITIPDSVTDIGSKAFYGCEGLADASGLVVICGMVHWCRPDITSVNIPGGVAGIGKQAFGWCSLTNVIIPEGVISVGNGAFCNCEHLTSVIISGSVTSIGDSAFENCKCLTSAIIPEGVTSIGNSAFWNCESLTSVTISSSVTRIGDSAFGNCKGLISMTIPEGVTSIGDNAFRGCEGLTNIVISEGVISIGKEAFSRCDSLTVVTVPASTASLGDRVFDGCGQLSRFEWLNPEGKFGKSPFGVKLPVRLFPCIEAIYPHLSDGSLKAYCLEKENWEKLPIATQAGIFLTCQGKTLLPVYAKCVPDPETLGEEILTRFHRALSDKESSAVASFLHLFSQTASTKLLQRLYDRLQAEKDAIKVLRSVEADDLLMARLKQSQLLAQSSSTIEETVARLLQQEKKSARAAMDQLTEFYSIKPANLPKIRCKDGSPVDSAVLAYLLTVHEKMGKNDEEWWKKQLDVLPAYEAPGICSHAAEIMNLLDQKTLQKGLLSLAKRYLGLSGRSKKMFLAYPICRYADETTMAELTKKAPKWASSVSGNNAPPLRTFRKAALYSETRSAMLFAEKYHELDAYASIRGMSVDVLRDRYLSDIGLDERGGRLYDLGNQVVTARLQSDLSFLVELPDGKTARSLPEKGADLEKYEAAKADLNQRKKDAKRIVKARCATLFEDFLSGRGRSAEEWQAVYLHNPLLRSVAKLLVWSQEEDTFSLTNVGAVHSNGQDYQIGTGDIRVAHPVEMSIQDLTAWQEYFRTNGLKQPFMQIWEPAFDPAKVQEDRYDGCTISYQWVQNAEKHGIHYFDEDFHNAVYFTLDDCELENWITDQNERELSDCDTFTLGKFTFKKYTRQVNHLVYLFDKWTIRERIQKDDMDVIAILGRYNVAQITEFLNIATESHAINLTAALLEYKQTHFPAYDAFAEFTLD